MMSAPTSGYPGIPSGVVRRPPIRCSWPWFLAGRLGYRCGRRTWPASPRATGPRLRRARTPARPSSPPRSGPSRTRLSGSTRSCRSGLHGVHLVGHSFGGATAAAYARAHPERVHSLTLMEPSSSRSGTRPVKMLWWATVATLPGMPDGIRKHALAQIGGGEDGGDGPGRADDRGGQQAFLRAAPHSLHALRRWAYPDFVDT